MSSLIKDTDHFARLNSATSVKECVDLASECTAAIGFSSFAYDYTSNRNLLRKPTATPSMLEERGLPDDYTDHWMDQKFYSRDTCWRRCHISPRPFIWTCFDYERPDINVVHFETTQETLPVIEYLNDNELKAGITIPIHLPDGGLSTINVIQNRADQSFVKNASKNLGEFALFAYHFHEAIGPMLEAFIGTNKTPKLTSKEIECLQLAARGYSTEQIADAIFRSVPTAALHLKNSSKKLGARNRAHAVALATHYRMV